MIQKDIALFVCGCGCMGWEGHGCEVPITNAMHNVCLSVFDPSLSFPLRETAQLPVSVEHTINSTNTHIHYVRCICKCSYVHPCMDILQYVHTHALCIYFVFSFIGYAQ